MMLKKGESVVCVDERMVVYTHGKPYVLHEDMKMGKVCIEDDFGHRGWIIMDDFDFYIGQAEYYFIPLSEWRLQRLEKLDFLD